VDSDQLIMGDPLNILHLHGRCKNYIKRSQYSLWVNTDRTAYLTC
jgi:hypothetical protein